MKNGLMLKMNLILVLTLSGCGGFGNMGLSVLKTSPSFISLTIFQNLPPDQWKIDSSQRALTRSRALNFKGLCAPAGIAIQVVETHTARPVGSSVRCENDGTFQWSVTPISDGPYSLTFQASSAYVTQNVLIDTVPPAAPVILSRNVRGISGTVSNDTVEIRASGLGSFEPHLSTSQFNQIFSLSNGQTASFSFVAVDAAGNESAPTRVTVSAPQSGNLALASFSATALSANGTSHLLRNGNMTPWVQSMNPYRSLSGTLRIRTTFAKP